LEMMFLVHTRLRLTDINVGLKRGVLSPKNGGRNI